MTPLEVRRPPLIEQPIGVPTFKHDAGLAGSSQIPWVYALFFISGFPALIYQIVWQRALFTIYGVNIESVTIVVSAFMLGLGLGSVAGGMVSRIPRLPVLAAFGLIELCVQTIGEDDLIALRRTLDAMRAKAERGEAFAEEDQAFHMLLFHCLGNPVLDRLIEIFWVAFHKASGFFRMTNPDPIATWRDHERIYEAVVARDAAEARVRLERHYEGIKRVLSGKA